MLFIHVKTLVLCIDCCQKLLNIKAQWKIDHIEWNYFPWAESYLMFFDQIKIKKKQISLVIILSLFSVFFFYKQNNVWSIFEPAILFVKLNFLSNLVKTTWVKDFIHLWHLPNCHKTIRDCNWRNSFILDAWIQSRMLGLVHFCLSFLLKSSWT